MRRIGSLCSGVDGLALGLERAGVGRTVWHAEVDSHASRVLSERWPSVPNHGDLKTAIWERVEPVDLLVGGYPCQPFSHAGQRRGVDDERHLWPHVLNALRVLRPPLALFENVAGHASLGLDVVLRDLAEVGFDAWWGTVRASDLGAPHRRERLFIAATDTRHGAGSLAGDPSWHQDAREAIDHSIGGGAAIRAATDAGCERRPQVPGSAPSGEEPCQRHPDGDHQPRRDGASGGGGWSDDEQAPTESEDERQQRGGITWRRGTGPAVGCEPPTDAHGQRACWAAQEQDGPIVGRGVADDGMAVAWGAYGPAIRRWERLTRSAPDPVDERGRLDPIFVEWLMGFPEGFVTDLLPRTAALRCLGNAVVPQVAEWVGSQIGTLAKSPLSGNAHSAIHLRGEPAQQWPESGGPVDHADAVHRVGNLTTWSRTGVDGEISC